MDKLIVKYYRGDYTGEDLVKLKELFGREENDAHLADIMQMQWNLCDNSAIGDKERFDAVLAQIHHSIEMSSLKRSTMRQFLIGFSKVAAILIVPLFVALFFLLQHNLSKNRLEAQNTIAAPRGTIKQLTLPDGTEVWLNAGSNLSYNKDAFNDKIRKVNLTGEAYFEVTKNPHKPFIVHANEISVKVLGTKFDVKSYNEDSKVNVTLMEGSVRLTDSQETPSNLCLLKPNQQATLNKQSRKLAIRSVDAQNANEWIRGKFIFENEELDQIAHCLEREYNVTIQIRDNGIKQLRFYGIFKRTQSLDEILNIVVSRQDFHYTKKGNVIVFSNNQ
jgi:ferric-dicitrate binding protein FerR (iron transport regulator)